MKIISALLFLVMVFFAGAQTLSVSIEADKMIGCPGDEIHLSANVTGASQPDSLLNIEWFYLGPVWFTTGYGDSIAFTLRNSGNAQIRVIVVDGTDTAMSLTTLMNAKPEAKISSSDDSMNCGESIVLTAYAIGDSIAIQGLRYDWSAPYLPDTNVIELDAVPSSPITVSITNNIGCVATTALSPSYRNRVSNVASFTVPPKICACWSSVFTNTSARKSGWQSTWGVFAYPSRITFDFANASDWVFTFINPGNYPVDLIMDSSGCKFYAYKLISSLPPANSLCGPFKTCNTDVDEIAESQIKLSPNPSSGRLKIAASDDLYPAQMSLHTILGRQAADFQITNAEQELDLSALPDGIYFLLLQSIHQKEKPVVKRLVISR